MDTRWKTPTDIDGSNVVQPPSRSGNCGASCNLREVGQSIAPKRIIDNGACEEQTLWRAGCRAQHPSKAESKSFTPEEAYLGNKHASDSPSDHSQSTQRPVHSHMLDVQKQGAQPIEQTQGNAEQMFYDIDDRLLDFYPYRLSVNPVNLFEQTSPQITSQPLDHSKLSALEENLRSRGLFLLNQYIITPQLRYLAEQQGGIRKVLVSCTGPYPPDRILPGSGRFFKWTIIFLAGDGNLTEYDEESGLYPWGPIDSVNFAMVGKNAAAFIEKTGFESDDEDEP